MLAIAKLNYLRISPRKVRLVANLIKGMLAKDALAQLAFIPKNASRPLSQLLRSAIANAEHNQKMSKDGLYIKTITVDAGPTLKRVQPRAMGRAFTIRKRSSHINLTLDIKDVTGVTDAKNVKTVKATKDAKTTEVVKAIKAIKK